MQLRFVVALLALATGAAAADLRVVTWNIHSGMGPDMVRERARPLVERNLARIAAAVVEAGGTAGVDVVGLNEVDFQGRRSGDLDQASFLAAELERTTGARYAVVVGETWRRAIRGFDIRFGNAALVRLPLLRAASCFLESALACSLSGSPPPPFRSRGFLARLFGEPRGVIKLTALVDDVPVDVLVTHLDAFVAVEREAEAADLVRRFVSRSATTVLLGDMNAVPYEMTRQRRFFRNDRTHEILGMGGLLDVRLAASGLYQALPTFPATAPVWPLDHVFVSRDLRTKRVAVIGADESDHRGLYAELELGPRLVQAAASGAEGGSEAPEL